MTVNTNQVVVSRSFAADFSKGLLITLMVFGHITFIGSSSLVLDKLVEYIYIFHMPVFFILSGIYSKRRTGLIVIVQLFRSLFVPYFVFIIIYIVAIYLAGRYGIQVSNKVDNISFLIIMQHVFLEPIGAYWFLHTLILLQLLFIFALWMEKLDFHFGLTFSVGCILLVVSPISFDVGNALYFCVGLLITRWLDGGIPKNIYFLLIASIAFFCFEPSVIQSDFAIKLVVVLSVLVALYGIAEVFVEKLVPVGNVFQLIGRNTLVILLLHALFINLCKLLSTWILAVDQSGYLYATFVTVLVIGLCLLSARLSDLLALSPSIFGKKEAYQKVNVLAVHNTND